MIRRLFGVICGTVALIIWSYMVIVDYKLTDLGLFIGVGVGVLFVIAAVGLWGHKIDPRDSNWVDGLGYIVAGVLWIGFIWWLKNYELMQLPIWFSGLNIGLGVVIIGGGIIRAGRKPK